MVAIDLARWWRRVVGAGQEIARAVGDDIVDQVRVCDLQAVIDHRNLDACAANSQRVQDVHVQIHAGQRASIAEHWLALIEQMPLVAEQRVVALLYCGFDCRAEHMGIPVLAGIRQAACGEASK